MQIILLGLDMTHVFKYQYIKNCAIKHFYIFNKNKIIGKKKEHFKF
jgi:hypothetical protein